MNSGVTAERVFDALKRRLLSGELLPGEKLEPARFADECSSSVTPIRDALHRLTGERVVETRTSDGFHLPLVTEPGLRDLYAWHAQLARLAVMHWGSETRIVVQAELPIDIARATPILFGQIARRSDNPEHAASLSSANDRLATARAAEALVMPDLEDELRALAVCMDTAPRAQLIKLLARYHRRRDRAAPAIVRAMYRG